jgi:hypothetical protein
MAANPALTAAIKWPTGDIVSPGGALSPQGVAGKAIALLSQLSMLLRNSGGKIRMRKDADAATCMSPALKQIACAGIRGAGDFYSVT